jgi:hypothetical protein
MTFQDENVVASRPRSRTIAHGERYQQWLEDRDLTCFGFVRIPTRDFSGALSGFKLERHRLFSRGKAQALVTLKTDEKGAIAPAN